MTPLIFLDTETTGLCPDVHCPWEVAWITAIHDPATSTLQLVSQYQATVPLTFRQLERADQEALKIGHYEERRTHNLRDVHEVIAELTRACAQVSAKAGTEKVPHLVGAVPGFDHAMICQNWTGWPGFGEGLWHYHLIDVEVLAAARWRAAPPYNTTILSELAGCTIEEKDQHTALGDTRWAVNMYAKAYELEVKPYEADE